MTEHLKNILPYLEVLGLISLPTFLISLLLIPWLIGKLPYDYFSHNPIKRSKWFERHPFIKLSVSIARNMIGVLFLFTGFIMLFLPGQGILTMILGLSLMSFPGKRAIMTSLTHRPTVQRSLNWIRKNSSKKPFIWEAPGL